jgi:GLPGLI family protein
MRTLFIFFALVIITVKAAGQDSSGNSITSGKVIFEERIKMDIKLEGDAAQFSESLPKEQVSNKVLLFTTDYSLYQADEAKKSEDPVNAQDSRMTVKMFVSGGNDKTFSDLKNKKKVEQKEFMTRMFLVEGDLGNQDWKFTGSFRTILGYNCQEAVRQDKDKKISVWFSPSIPVAAGPGGYSGLPGLVLHVDIDNGKRTINATSVDPSFNDASLIVRPKEGKKVTSEEFKKIVDEKMKEMGGEGGEGGNHVIIRMNVSK